ncbi:19991_t:CDS:1, partial [Gigaspora margarita]
QNALEITPVIIKAFNSHLKKLKELLHIYFGPIIYIIDVIEFQKYRFPYAHIVVHVQPKLPIDQIDKIISAELPNKNSHLKKLVEKYMIHRLQYSSHCLRNGKCIYQYPKPIIPETYIDKKGYVQYRHRTQNDAWVVPYNPILLLNLECHINFEIAFTVNLFMYLYKYFFKGPDYVKYNINTSNTKNSNSTTSETTNNNESSTKSVNKFKDYINRRYLLALEAAWRIFRYPITTSDPSVQILPIHLLNTNIPQYSCSQNNSLSISLLNHYFF